MQHQSQSGSAPAGAPRSPVQWPASMVEELSDISARHGFGLEAAQAMWEAMSLGQGGMAQFSHPALGGNGQWMRGGMLMIGDMFDHGLKARVNALCEDIARLYTEHPQWHRQMQASLAAGTEWWPAGLHSPSTSGAQNGIRYAYFPAQRRLAIERAGAVELYDTGDHLIAGVSQEQGDRNTLAFASQQGPVALCSLKRLDEARPIVPPAPGVPSAVSAAPAPVSYTDTSHEDNPKAAIGPSVGAPAGAPTDRAAGLTLDTIERLAGLRDRGVLSEAEFIAKKTELLGRL